MALNPASSQNLGTIGSGAAQLYSISRPYSTAYGLLLGIGAILTTDPTPAWYAIVTTLLVAFCFPLGSVALHDGMHRAADERAGRGRNYDQRLLVAIGALNFAIVLLIAFSHGPLTLVWVLVSITTGLGYGMAKSIPIFSNIIRGSTSSALILTIGSMTSITNTTLLFALAAGLLDAAGNLWGDVRDVPSDRRAGVMTIAVVSPALTRVCAIALHTLAVSLFTLINVGYLVGLPFGVAPLFVANKRSHRIYLMFKYALVGLVAFSLTTQPASQLLALGLTAFAVPSFALYRQLHHLDKGDVL